VEENVIVKYVRNLNVCGIYNDDDDDDDDGGGGGGSDDLLWVAISSNTRKLIYLKITDKEGHAMFSRIMNSQLLYDFSSL
jgi:hypothetical protein